MMMEAAADLERYGFTVTKPIKDEDGIVGVVLNNSGDWYVCVAKQYAYQNMASFMKVVAETAKRDSVDMIFYQNDTEEYTVFDPEIVAEFGEDSVGDSKKSSAEWREIPLSYGITLQAHLDGEMATLPNDQAQIGSWV